MALAGIRAGMTVADIGAGEGYYTIRLAERVGAKGRVLAEDIIPEVRNRLAERVYRERLDNVSVRLGAPADPKLPAKSFDRILMVHMYHEIEAPYEFLWRMRPSLKPGGRVVIVDYHRPAAWHPLRPLMRLVFGRLEPFAMDLWRHDVQTFLPAAVPPVSVVKTTYFGGLYQLLVLTR